MTTILTIKTNKQTEKRSYDILIRPNQSAAVNVLRAADEIVKDFEKDNPTDEIREISFVLEENEKELAVLKF